MPYYAVAKGKSAGVYNNWNDCRENVNGYSGATYKKFNTQSEAQNFVSERSGSSYSSRSSGGGYSGGSSSRYSGSSSGGYSGGSSGDGRGSYSRTDYGSSSGGSGYGSSYSSSRSSTKSSAQPEKIYVDGAARGNGRDSCPKSGYGVYYGSGDSRNRAVPLSDVDNVSQVKPTNQRAELHAMNHALENIRDEHSANPSSTKSYEIHTDSTYTKKSIDTWADKWSKNDWKTSTGSNVANRDLIEKTHTMYNDLKDKGVPVDIVHVKGHSGVEGNEQADRLANQGADLM